MRTAIRALAATALVAATSPLPAATLTVDVAGEPASLAATGCSPGACTLRAAINAAQTGDVIVFAPALDGQTIALTKYTNCLAVAEAASETCLPLPSWPTIGGMQQVTQFGPSAFFISGRAITVDASALEHGIVIARDLAAPDFRLFDVAGDGSLGLVGVTLAYGVARGADGGYGGGALGAGGAIFNQGELRLERCTLVANRAIGGGVDAPTGLLIASGAGVGEPPSGSAAGGPNADTGGFGAGGGTTVYHGGFGGGGRSDGNGGFGGGGGGTLVTGATSGFGGGNIGFAYVGGAGAAMGGAIFNDGGSVTLANATLAGNSAQGGAGNTSSLSGTGSGLGGAIFNYAGSVTLSFATLFANAVSNGSVLAADGAAIYSLGDGWCGVSSDGESPDGNVCPHGAEAALVIANSVVASDEVASDVVVHAINGGASTAAGSGNLIRTIAVDGGATSSLAVADPEAIGNLQLTMLSPPLRGGFADVLAPSSGSSVTDAAASCEDAEGAVVTADQRRAPRPQGAQCDAGAAETQPALTVALAQGSPAYVTYGQVVDYVVTLTNGGTAAATAHAVEALPGAGADVASTTWQCIAGSTGATCTPAGNGPIDDDVTIPPGVSMTWLVHVPVSTTTLAGTLDFSFTASGLAPLHDSATIVLFRDGFDAADADRDPDGRRRARAIVQ